MTSADHKKCVQCGKGFSTERPFDYCLADACVKANLAAKASRMTMVLQHKVGYMPQFVDHVSNTNKNGT